MFHTHFTVICREDDCTLPSARSYTVALSLLHCAIETEAKKAGNGEAKKVAEHIHQLQINTVGVHIPYTHTNTQWMGTHD